MHLFSFLEPFFFCNFLNFYKGATRVHNKAHVEICVEPSPTERTGVVHLSSYILFKFFFFFLVPPSISETV